jgi:branched-chain amino acid transport system ATP-binding protein
MDALMTTPILATRDLGKRFGQFVALKGVSVDFPEGRITSIIGPNGAGKSTLFNLLSGGNRPSSGSIAFQGVDITGLPRHQYARLGIAKSFQITSIFRTLSVLENVRIAVQSRVRTYDFITPREDLPKYSDRAREILEQVGLGDKTASQASELSHGEQRCLDIAIALACNPKLLLLDEPTAGMSPEETRAVMDLVLQLSRSHTVVLVEHKMKLIMGISDHVIVLHHGELLAQGTPDEVHCNEEVRRVYLGKVKG